jgi:hypothetical protein
LPIHNDLVNRSPGKTGQLESDGSGLISERSKSVEQIQLGQINNNNSEQSTAGEADGINNAGSRVCPYDMSLEKRQDNPWKGSWDSETLAKTPRAGSLREVKGGDKMIRGWKFVVKERTSLGSRG